MKSKIFLAKNKKALLLLLLSSSAWAQQQRLTVSSPEQFTIKRGAVTTQSLKVTVQPGSHVNSDKPTGEYIVPLKLEWENGPVKAESISYPQPEQLKVGAETLSVFTGSFLLSTHFRASPEAAAGPLMLNGRIHYQACNDQMCFRPAFLAVRVPAVIQ